MTVLHPQLFLIPVENATGSLFFETSKNRVCTLTVKVNAGKLIFYERNMNSDRN